MTVMLWVKMPTEWISHGLLRSSFSGPKVGEDIAALKIYLVLCLLSKEVQRPVPSPSYLKITGNVKMTGVLECSATYDQLTEMCSLSRSLVSRGLTKLREMGLINVEGGYRSKKYRLSGSVERRWCKLPKRALVHNEERIPMLSDFFNRYNYERNALKLYFYILASRTNSKRHVDLSRGVISKKTGVSLLDIDGALGFLQSIGFIAKIESRGYLARSQKISEENKLHRYWVTGNEALYYRTFTYSDDLEDEDEGEDFSIPY